MRQFWSSSRTFFVLGFYTLQLVYSYLKFYEGEKVLVSSLVFVVQIGKIQRSVLIPRLYTNY